MISRVTADGTFQFATGLAQGAGYNVTVKSTPRGPDVQRVGREWDARDERRHHCHGHVHRRVVTPAGRAAARSSPAPRTRMASRLTSSRPPTTDTDRRRSGCWLRPTLRAGVPHNFLYVLPVEPELGAGTATESTCCAASTQKTPYNLTIIEPTFAIDPWYADNPNDPNVQYDTFMTDDLVPWVRHNLAPSTGHEENWLIGFSKSGIGATDLILRHPDVFTLAAAWDFPADMGSFNDFGTSSAA